MYEIKEQFEHIAGMYHYGDSIYLIDGGCSQGVSSLLPLVTGREITTNKTVFLLCKKGSLDLKVNYLNIHLEANSSLIILPEMIIETLSISEDPQIITILLSEEFTNSLNINNTYRSLLSIRHQPVITLPEDVREALINLYEMVRGLLTVPSHPNIDKVLHSLFEAYFYGIDPYLHKSNNRVIVSAAEMHTEEFLLLVEKNFRQRHTVEWYADQLRITAKRLNICVKQTTNQTASEWIERHRLLEAARLLQNSSIPIKEIASSLDFPSQSSFGTWFKQKKGYSPNIYRKQTFTPFR